MIGGDLYGPIDLQASFWVLAKDDGGDDELTQGQTCIEVGNPSIFQIGTVEQRGTVWRDGGFFVCVGL